MLDWLLWIDENNAYVKQKLDNLVSPKGFVIIGRDKLLTEKERKKLKMRNSLHFGKIEILTYDDVLKKAKSILKSLKKL